MKIAVFGTTYAGGYAFPTYRASDDMTTERPSIVTRVGGASGAYDFIGTTANPIAPVIVRKNFSIAASTYAGVETALETARSSLLAAAENKLWALMRDNTKRWTWAKVTAFSAPENVGTRLTIPVSVEFMCRDGVWYNETQHTQNIATATSTVIANAGNTKAALRVDTGGDASVSTLSTTNSTNGSGWSFDATSFGIFGVDVDPAAYSAMQYLGSTDYYQYLTPSVPGDLWLYLSPGNNTIVTANTGGTANGWNLYWYDTWVM